MTDAAPSTLDLITTTELVEELCRRHTGDGRALLLVSLSPADGSPGHIEARTCVRVDSVEELLQCFMVVDDVIQKHLGASQ
jgi:hypothetical protein